MTKLPQNYEISYDTWITPRFQDAYMGPPTKNSESWKRVYVLVLCECEPWVPIQPNSVTFFEAKTEVKFNTYSNIKQIRKNMQ